MRTSRIFSSAFLLLTLAACGVPKSQYDAAMAEKSKYAEQIELDQKQLADLNAKIAELQAKSTSAEQSGQATLAELEELRAQKAAAEARAKLFDDFVKKFQSMIDAGKLDITTRHGQIVLALATDIVFDTGKTEIKPEGKSALAEIGAALKGVPGRRFQVSGHTDTVPIKTKEFASNWELSTARAVAVVKVLIGEGVKADVVSAAGYAEFDPAQPNTTEKGKAKNRRIEIVLVPNIEELVKLPELKPAKSIAEKTDKADDETAKPATPPKPPAPKMPKKK